MLDEIVEAVAPAAPAPVVDVDPFDAGADSFPREYVEKLRREAAEYRTSYAPYRDTFSDVDEDVKGYLLDLNKQLLTDPTAAAEELEILLHRIRGTDPAAAEALEDKVQAVIDDDRPLTLKEWKSIQAKEAEDGKKKSEVDKIFQDALALDPSYNKETDDYGDMASLLYIATNKTKGDLTKAHALRAERFNSAVESEVEKRLSDIKSGARKWSPQTSIGATPIEPKDEPKDFATARKRAEARLTRLLAGD